MSTVYRKTDKGRVEIQTRALGLLPRLRRALILVDGRRTEEDLDKLIPGDLAVTLGALLAQGFIEAALVVVDLPLEPMHSLDQTGTNLETLKHEAARFLLDKLGPSAEGLAIKLERAKSLSEAQPLLLGAAQILRSVRGGTPFDEFTARFVRPLQIIGG